MADSNDCVIATKILGGMTDRDANDLGVVDAAKFAVEQYNKEKEATLEFVKVVKAQSQIVAGVIYKLILEAKDGGHNNQYDALVYIKPDNSKELNEFHEHQSTIPGGWEDAGNDVGIEDLAKFAVDEYNKEEKTTLEYSKLKRAEKLLVSGVIYRLTMEAIHDGRKGMYQAKVLVVAWEGIKKLEDFKQLLMDAEDSVVTTKIIGGMTNRDANDLGVVEAGKFAIEEYNKEKGATLEFVKVVKAQSQIVAGVNYKLILEAKDGDHKKTYDVLVFENLHGSKELKEFHAHPTITGGWTDAGNDVGIEDLAKFAVDEYNKEKKTTLEYSEMKKAEKQIVAGVLYRLTLEVIHAGRKNIYQAKVLVVSWEGIKKLEDFQPLLRDAKN